MTEIRMNTEHPLFLPVPSEIVERLAAGGQTELDVEVLASYARQVLEAREETPAIFDAPLIADEDRFERAIDYLMEGDQRVVVLGSKAPRKGYTAQYLTGAMGGYADGEVGVIELISDLVFHASSYLKNNKDFHNAELEKRLDGVTEFLVGD